jgi:hypothetical protein
MGKPDLNGKRPAPPKGVETAEQKGKRLRRALKHKHDMTGSYSMALNTRLLVF